MEGFGSAHCLPAGKDKKVVSKVLGAIPHPYTKAGSTVADHLGWGRPRRRYRRRGGSFLSKIKALHAHVKKRRYISRGLHYASKALPAYRQHLVLARNAVARRGYGRIPRNRPIYGCGRGPYLDVYLQGMGEQIAAPRC